MNASADATVLAFDFGTRRIGVALGNTLLRQARPLATVSAANADAGLDAIAALVREWRPARLVVGLPTHADGRPHVMTARARAFGRALAARFALPVDEVDERFTTEAAQARLDAEHAGRAGRAARDAIAAQIILQAWFDEPRHDE